MNLISILAGGIGSGCNPKVGKCGRKGTGKIQISTGRIFVNGVEVGTFFHEMVKNTTKKHIVDDLFDGHKIPSLSLPKKFDYAWIDEMKLDNRYRGKGLGSEVLQSFERSLKKTTLVALNPGEISKNVSINSLLRFYKKNGFTLMKIGKDNYGFKVIKK